MAYVSKLFKSALKPEQLGYSGLTIFEVVYAMNTTL